MRHKKEFFWTGEYKIVAEGDVDGVPALLIQCPFCVSRIGARVADLDENKVVCDRGAKFYPDGTVEKEETSVIVQTLLKPHMEEV